MGRLEPELWLLICRLVLLVKEEQQQLALFLWKPMKLAQAFLAQAALATRLLSLSKIKLALPHLALLDQSN
jgi:hypothetical protein